jgi:hypothetical protein
VTRAYEEIIDFIAAGSTPGAFATFRPSPEAQARVSELIHREKTATLSPDEAAKLNRYLQLEHLMRLAKARARAYIAAS